MRKAYPEEKSRTWKIVFSTRKITISSGDDTFYVHPPRAHGFIHGDVVSYIESRASKDRKMAEAKPLKLIKRSQDEVIIEGHISKKWVKWSLLPVFGNLAIEVSSNPKIEDGDLYVGIFESARRVRIVRKFWNMSDSSVQEELIFFRSGVRTKWPASIEHLSIEKPSILWNEDQIKEFSIGLLPQSMSLKDDIFPKIQVNARTRYDLRGWYTLTIDGADAKDLDDAISIAKYEWGDTLLWVHIADVAEYVTEKSEIDREGFLRGTSIYTPGRVIPMLPEILSNDLCSLHPGGPKLTLSIFLRIDRQGFVKESFVTEGVIESRHRWIYEEIELALRGEPIPRENPPPKEIIKQFQTLYHLLSERRKKEGKIIFETTECYFDMDEEHNVTNIRKRERWDAHMMIEEFMVLANEEVAKWAIKRKVPFLSRVHEAPSAEKSREIIDILMANKESIGEEIIASIGDDIEPHHIRSILEKASSQSELFYRFSRLLLPKMAKAVYGEKPVRHFGLALTHYAHFTSPIRRYPDLLLHRMIKYHLSKVSKFDKKSYDKQMKKWGESLSEKERTAEDVSRAVWDVVMCRYMSKFVGSVYTGVISWVTESNVYVELENGVEGSIYLSAKGSPKWMIDMARGSLRDTSGKEIYRIGEKIRVKIASVDMEARRIEMEVLAV